MHLASFAGQNTSDWWRDWLGLGLVLDWIEFLVPWLDEHGRFPVGRLLAVVGSAWCGSLMQLVCIDWLLTISNFRAGCWICCCDHSLIPELALFFLWGSRLLITQVVPFVLRHAQVDQSYVSSTNSSWLCWFPAPPGVQGAL